MNVDIRDIDYRLQRPRRDRGCVSAGGVRAWSTFLCPGDARRVARTSNSHRCQAPHLQFCAPSQRSRHPGNQSGIATPNGIPSIARWCVRKLLVRRDGSRSAVSRETVARFRRGNDNSCVSYAVHKLATFPRRFDTPRDSRANRLDSGRPRYGPNSWGIWSFSPVSRETLQVPNTNWRNATRAG